MNDEIKLNEKKPATIKKMLSFALGAIIFQTIANSLTQLVFYYYEVEVGLPVVLVMVALISFAIWNMINDPYLGYLTDRPMKWTNKWGWRFPWIIISVFPLLLFYILLFAIPNDLVLSGNTGMVFFYFIVIMFLLDTFSSLFSIHYDGGIAKHFPTENERRKYSAIRALSIGIVLIPLSMIGPSIIIPGDRSSYLTASILLVIVLIVLAIALIPGIRENKELTNLYIRGYETAEKKNFFQVMKIALKHKNFRLIVIANLLATTGAALYLASQIYFLVDILGVPFENARQLNLLAFLGMLIGVPIWTFLSKKYGFKKTYMIGLLLLSIVFLPILMISNLEQMYFISLISGIIISCTSIMFYSIIQDTYDEVAITMKKRQDSTLTGIENFFERSSIILQALIIGIVHIITAYNVAPSAIQTSTAIWGIRIHMGLIPTILAVVGFLIVLKWYDIEGKKKEDIISKLNEMKL
jgi:GPH family glycoside/pentoside/hexuronide:cation symporter